MVRRKAVSPIFATLLLLFVGVFLAGAIWVWDTVGSSDDPPVYRFEFVSVRSVRPVSVENAGWQLELLIRNQGNVDDVIEKIYVNRVLIKEMGLSPGDSLSSTSSVGTDIPVGGLVVSAGDTEVVYLWVGVDLVTKGTTITVEVQRQNQYEMTKYITLN